MKTETGDLMVTGMLLTEVGGLEITGTEVSDSVLTTDCAEVVERGVTTCTGHSIMRGES